jgi:hypothetical protein
VHQVPANPYLVAHLLEEASIPCSPCCCKLHCDLHGVHPRVVNLVVNPVGCPVNPLREARHYGGADQPNIEEGRRFLAQFDALQCENGQRSANDDLRIVAQNEWPIKESVGNKTRKEGSDTRPLTRPLERKF